MVSIYNDTSRNYSTPFRRLPIAMLNQVGKTLGINPSITVEGLMQAARRKTGLSDFGDLYFKEALDVLVNSINQEANLTLLGRLIQKGRLESSLAVRLRVIDLLKKHPEIADIDLGTVIVIAALQRTGTTTLHRLLAADPDIRSLKGWEALNPLPEKNEQPGNHTGRVRKGKLAERAFAYIAPEFFAIHPIEHEAPEEEILLLDLSFVSGTPEAMMHVPTYSTWLENHDCTKGYEFLKTCLQVLQFYQPAKNWVLKTPHHMEYLDTLLKVFPDAKIVQTHRDPQKTMGSFCSMVAHGRGILSDSVDPKEVARHWTRKVERMIRRSMNSIDTHDSKSFIDISYYDLLQDPIAELEKIYAFAGLPFTGQARQAAIATTKVNKQNRYGKHIYRLEDFDLSPEKIESQFKFYRDKYQIPVEKKAG